LLILDDFLSSLDRKTRHIIADKLFGPNGHIHRHGLTVVLATHTSKFVGSQLRKAKLTVAANYVHYSETVIVMGAGGSLEYIGPPENSPNFSMDMTIDQEIGQSKELTGKEAMIAALKERFADKRPLPPLTPETETTKRQSGDWGVWWYYGKAIGAWPLIFAVIFVMTAVFANNFPSKS
jgi:ATP-binding cassette subfamily C (CFTR/MRP) protein 1